MSLEPEEISEEEIINRIINGNVNLYEQVLQKYEGYVLTIVKRHVPTNMIEDTIQEAFIRIYQSLPGFKNQGGFKQWLSTVTVRTCYDCLRKLYRSREQVMSSMTEDYMHWLDKITSAESGEKFHQAARQKEAKEILDKALKHLSAEERIVLELVHLEGYSGKEAAKLLGWSTANVKIRAYRSRQKLRSFLAELLH
jgi:RNA polymerase sigma-70 factor, ECF subfamily